MRIVSVVGTRPQLIKAAIDPERDYAVSVEMIARVQTAVAYKILREAKLSDAELDELLAEAVELASRD